MITRGIRIMGMTILFTIPVAMLVEHWKYAAPAIMAAVITGIFVGEVWHRWREESQKISSENQKERKVNS